MPEQPERTPEWIEEQNRLYEEKKNRIATKIKDFFLSAPPPLQLEMARNLLSYWEEYGTEIPEMVETIYEED